MSDFVLGTIIVIVIGIVGQRIEDRIATGSWRRPWTFF